MINHFIHATERFTAGPRDSRHRKISGPCEIVSITVKDVTGVEETFDGDRWEVFISEQRPDE